MSRERPVVEDGDAPATITVEDLERPDDRATAPDDAARPDVTRALGERVVELERELERRERRHARVVERYERLLDEAREPAEESSGYVDWVRSLL